MLKSSSASYYAFESDVPMQMMVLSDLLPLLLPASTDLLVSTVLATSNFLIPPVPFPFL